MPGRTTSRRTKHSSRHQGLTLVEMIIAMSVFLVAAALAMMALRPAWQDARLSSAYNDVLMMMRRVREASIAERRTYLVRFDSDIKCNQFKCGQVTMCRLLGGLTGAPDAAMTIRILLPVEVQFAALPGIPKSSSGTDSTPDGWGSGAQAIDFDQGVKGGAADVIYFQPDGSARDVNNNINNGVIYIARADDLYSSRAISLWGAAGRIRGWRLYDDGKTGTTRWREQ